MDCQYRTADTRTLGAGSLYTTQSRIRLEPRFRLLESEEIPEAEYPDDGSTLGLPYILQRGEQEVEFHFKGSQDPLSGSRRMRVSEILLLPEAPELSTTGEAGQPGTRAWEAFLESRAGRSELDAPFSTRIEKDTCGRILAPAFVKAVEYIEEEPLPDPVQVSAKVIAPTLSANKITVKGISPAPPAVERTGCLSVFGLAGIGGGGGGGCLLPLLMLGLGVLLGGIVGSNGCGRTASSVAPAVVHDTVFLEVERTDTLIIVKKDTVSYVDSTTSVTYESVNLPNVQFISNSGVLLPSSATELQQLAEYLLTNDSLTATIYGHTDSVGNPKANQRLSQSRAESVKRFLVSLGVDGDRLEAVGMGDTQPKADNRLEEGRLLNRRVEVKLTRSVVNTTKRSRVDSASVEPAKDSTNRR